MKLLISILAAASILSGAAVAQPSSYYDHQRYYNEGGRNRKQESDLILGIGLGIIISKSLEDRQYRSYREYRGNRYGSSYDRCFFTPYYDYYGVKRWFRECPGR